MATRSQKALSRLRLDEIPGVDIRVQDESRNQFGTHKDRRSQLIMQKALRKRVDTLVLITAGNAGNSLGHIAEGTHLKIVVVIKPSLSPTIKEALSSEQLIATARKSSEEVIWDVTNGYEDAYKTIIAELRQQNPSAIITPVGSGELFIGLHKGIQEYGLATRLIGVNAESPRTDKLDAKWSPLLQVVKNIAGKDNYVQLSEEEVEWCIEHAPPELNAEPSALVVLGALRRKRQELKDVILINSGQGLQ